MPPDFCSMRLVTLVGLLCSALTVAAQTTGSDPSTDDLLAQLAELPTCATSCIASSLSVSKCAFGDFDCLCTDDAYIASGEKCILASCTVKQALTTQAWQQKVCKAPYRNTGPITKRMSTGLIIVACLCVAFRFVSRWRVQGSTIEWDDWTILICLMMLIPSTVIIEQMADRGMGQDIWLVSFHNITLMFKYFWFEQFVYVAITVLTKVSIVLLYLRIFPKSTSHKFAYTCYTFIGLHIAYGLSIWIFCLNQCRPISYFWNQWDGEHEGSCANLQLGIYTGAAVNIVLDLMVFFLPVPKLMKLQVKDKRRKAGAIFTFLVGLFVTVCSIIRLKYLADFGKTTNATYHYNNVAIWSGVECAVGVICACMPPILGPVMYFFRTTVATKISSLALGSGSKSRMESRITGDKSITMSRSNAGHDDDEVELDPSMRQNGGIKKTSETTLHNVPSSRLSDDDVDFIYHNNNNHQRREAWEV